MASDPIPDRRILQRKSIRIAVLWLGVFALVAMSLVAWPRNRSDGPGSPRYLEDIRLLQASTTVTLIIENPGFPYVTLRAIVGPEACMAFRTVHLEQLVAGSETTIPMGSEDSGNFGNAAAFWPIPNVAGTQYWAVVDETTECDGAVSNIVTLPGPG